jgi:ATP-dependent exoDNAse (exonuclease V) alpha subunit
MMRELFYSIFLTIKFHSPHIKFIISGDFNQLEPVNDRDFFHYQHSKALYELVDGNKVLLTKCRRSDDKLFSLCKNILADKNHDVSELENRGWSSYKNICFTNRKRKAVNIDCMERFLSGKKTRMDVMRLDYDKNTQNYTLCEDMPLISRVNMKSMDVLNNEMFICSKILGDEVVVKNEFKTLSIPKSKFNKIFLMAFCITTHKSQGLSLNEPYCIHEFEKFDKKLKYVSLSRATNYNFINIVK